MMLSRQARCGASVRRAATLRSLGLTSGLLSSPSLSSSSSCQFQCPSLVRQHVVATQTQPWRRRLRLALGSHERSLATAMDDFKFDSMPSIPPFHTSFGAFELHNFDPSLPLRIPEPLGGPKPATKTSTHGIPGEAEDMLAVFDACIRVGKLERAALVLKRLNVSGVSSGEEQIVLNNRYLRATLDMMRTKPDPKQAEKLHKWYEVQIRNKDLPHTAETVACMLKASLLSERGRRLERLVQRYMGMAPGEAGLRVLSMADILSDQDLAIITEICPTYNYAVEEAELENLQDPSLAAEGQDGVTDSLLATTQAEASAQSKAFPEPVPTPQKGIGLDTLKQGLGLLFNLQEADLSKLPEAELREIQLQLERDSISSAVSKWRLERENLAKRGISSALGPSSNEDSISQQMGSWLDALEQRIKEELILTQHSEEREAKSEADLDRCIYGPFIQQADPARLAGVVILTTLNMTALLGADKGIPIAKLVLQLAKTAQEDIDKYQEDLAAEKARRRRKVTLKSSAKGKQKSKASSKAADLAKSAEEALETSDILITDVSHIEQTLKDNSRLPWSISVRAQVGSILIKMLIESAKTKVTMKHPVTQELLSQYQPAFTQMSQMRKGKKVGVIVLNPHLVTRLQKEPVGDFIAKHLPMIVEPQPWKNFDRGGFLDSVSSLVRVKPGNIEQKLYAEAAIKNGDMKQVFKGLDVLGKTAWAINKDVLNVMLEAWNSGEEIANFPPLVPDLEAPPEPDSSADPLLRTKWIKAVKAVENERSGLHSQRCFMNLQLEIARVFRNQTIYFPHNVDYRGRAYPMPTYLNHMGADHARALLKFANGKELGVKGLRWLKIHLANVYGFDKASFDEREKFADDHVVHVLESATNPLGGGRWWLEAEDPWQCLSTCFELKAALESPDPTKFVSNLPVHQDGTCNGLQHYAALGGDAWGARQVNLEPGERPADVYSAVANLVKDAIYRDAAQGNAFAKALTGKVTRKVVKQTVMTNVYGVTFAGAKKQVCKQIDALYPGLGKEVGIPHLLLSTYIAKHIFTALATMFRGAHDIQYWLGDIGGRVCRALTEAQLDQIAESYREENADAGKSEAKRGRKKQSPSATRTASFEELTHQFRSTVVWTTPLRMPVVQPYRKIATKEIRTCLQSIIYPVGDQSDPVNRRKQLQGFPPNFIHSLDASHMLLSALQCNERGLDFAAVHDSFWTHASDVDVMNEVLREAFIRIHEEDVVGRLATEFAARHGGSIYLANIDSSTPVAKKIKELRKESGLSPKEELLLEHKRNRLRLSADPKDQKEAKTIVTPASLLEEMAASAEDVEIREDTKAIGLGQIAEGEAAESAQQDRDELADLGDYADHLLSKASMNVVEAAMVEETPKATPARAATPVWIPLSIPPIPEKGEFDVKRLRESKYFFS